ncbi:adenomatous polyposis coli protein-like isoform X2 [Ischnura elegans]|uniref:adenomatous polyposis coli protein-like isoform X2 n=1 Tax=Ischnura elegans TaxID=197161 RepID=UPI001ED87172|nr:adenomatous polyposis coli protein-like isoform X2 [Ischnura elegans]
MTLPVSSYEDLLQRVRSLTYETRQLQRELTRDSPELFPDIERFSPSSNVKVIKENNEETSTPAFRRRQVLNQYHRLQIRNNQRHSLYQQASQNQAYNAAQHHLSLPAFLRLLDFNDNERIAPGFELGSTGGLSEEEAAATTVEEAACDNRGGGVVGVEWTPPTPTPSPPAPPPPHILPPAEPAAAGVVLRRHTNSRRSWRNGGGGQEPWTDSGPFVPPDVNSRLPRSSASNSVLQRQNLHNYHERLHIDEEELRRGGSLRHKGLKGFEEEDEELYEKEVSVKEGSRWSRPIRLTKEDEMDESKAVEEEGEKKGGGKKELQRGSPHHHRTRQWSAEVNEGDLRVEDADDDEDGCGGPGSAAGRARMTNSATQTPQQEGSNSANTAAAAAGNGGGKSACESECSEDGKMIDQEDMQGSKQQNSVGSLYHGAWPMDRSLWHSGPSSIGGGSINNDMASVMSFTSSVGSMGGGAAFIGGMGGVPMEGAASLPDGAARRSYSQQQLGAKVEMVYGLLSMLGTHDKEDMSRTLLAMSSSPDSCIAMRQSGCLPLLVQLLHGGELDGATRRRAARALHNVVHSHADDKRGRREARVLRLLEQVREYCDSLSRDSSNGQRSWQQRRSRSSGTDTNMSDSLGVEGGQTSPPPAMQEDVERHPGTTIAALMKLSFDEEHRHAMCQLGGLHAVAELIQVDHEAHGSTTSDHYCVMLRRYAGMALTNLTFGDGTNKALLCSFRPFMKALVAQLESPSEDLRQVTASVLRNLSWRADAASKQTLREVGAVTGLMRAAMEATKESTLKSILSALWNLSAHCSMNKADICAVEGALAFLVEMLSYKSPSKTLAIIENAGGILRNISSLIAVREDYRQILREHECLKVLLQQLKSPSLTIVSNACGTLWNLSARCGDGEDQRALLDMGAMSMLRSLVHSKHKMISMGSSAALKNLLSAQQQPQNQSQSQHQSHSHHHSHHSHHHHHSHTTQLSEDNLPSLQARKRRALQQELDQTLAETCENIEPSGSPPPPSGSMNTPSSLPISCASGLISSSPHLLPSPDANDPSAMTRSTSRRSRHRQQIPTRVGQPVPRSESRESVTSTRSDSACVGRSGHSVVRQHSLPPNGRAWEDSGLPCRRQRREEAGSEATVEDSVERQDRGRLPEPSYGNSERDCCSAPPQQRAWSTVNSESASSHKSGEDYRRRPSKDESVPRGEARPSSAMDSPSTNGNRQFSEHKTSYSSFHADNKGRYSPHKSASPHSKYSDYVYVEDEVQDQPVDYSLKYSEDGTPTMEPKKPDTDKATASQDGRKYPTCVKQCGPSRIRRIPVHGNESSIYGVYTETDLDNPDQPTNYSLRYAEGEDPDLGSKGSASLMPPPASAGVVSHRENEPSPMYYDRTSASVHDDTVMTYCTEGTPYETPCNFSTATSMSDLRETAPTLENVQEEPSGKKEIKQEKVEDQTARNGVSPKVEEVLSGECSGIKEEKDFPKEKTQHQLTPAPTSIRQCESSGLLTPEKPVQYGVEGTPVCFSRVSSLSSLHSVDARGSEPVNEKVCVPDEIIQGSPSSSSGLAQELPKTPSASPGSISEQVVPGYQEVISPGGQECSLGVVRRIPKGIVSPSGSGSQDSPKVPSECGRSPGVTTCARDLKEEMRPDREGGKVVTFGGADHYAEETPLMFSRCSSLGSLSSFEQHSIHDDRSSVISDFSRRTSGVVSPSELPDSPTQTVPSSPRHSKAPVDFTSRIAEGGVAVRAQPQSIPVLRHTAGRPIQNKSSVFEDDVAAFKEEDTPIEFSTATSLSSLTIDDEPKISHDAALKEVTTKCSDDIREGTVDLGQGRSTMQSHHDEISPQADAVEGGEEEVSAGSQEASAAACPSSSGAVASGGDDDDEGMEKQDTEKEKREDGELAPVSEGEEGDENDEDMLADCINIGMQNNRHRQRQFNNNKNILRAGRFGAIANMRGRPSGIPVKAAGYSNSAFGGSSIPMPVLRQQQERPSNCRMSQDNARAVSQGKPVGYGEVPAGPCDDAVSTYCTEGTPANISHAGSHSDLSVLSLPDQMRDGDDAEEGDRSVQREHCARDLANEEIRGLSEGDKNKELDSPAVPMTTPPTPLSTGSHHNAELSDDSSSFSGDNDNILAECIQSAMPKARPQHRRPQQPPMMTPSAQMRRKGPILAAGPRRPAGVGHLCGPGMHNAQVTPLQHKYGIPHPRVQEMVPQNRIQRDEECEQRLGTSQESGQNYQKALRMPMYSAARDEMETYATEGSPNTFSNATSLSDLTINSSPEGASCLRSLRRMVPSVPSGGATGHATAEGSPLCDTPIRYATEDTPLEISHAASLSSLSIGEEDDEEPKASSNSGSPKHGKGGSPHRSLLPRPATVGHSDPSSEGRPGSSNGGDDNSEAGRGATYSSGRQKTSSLSEEVVTVLSRNGSLSSLSVDSLGAEPTPSEQALLEQCIHSAMPKSKSDLGGGARGVVMATRRPLGGNPPMHSHQMGPLHGAEVPSLPNVTPHRLELCSRAWEGSDAVDDPEYAHRSMDDRLSAAMSAEQVSKNVSGSAVATAVVAADEAVEDATKHTEGSLLPPHPHRVEGMVTTTERLVEANSMEEGRNRKENTLQEIPCPPAPAVGKEIDCFLQIIEKDVDSSPESSPGMAETPSSGGENLTTGESPSEGPSDSVCGTKETASSTGSTRDSGSGRGQKVHDMKQSFGSNTWNEDSPNSVSFPSISISAPLISSFRSDLGATQGGEANISELEEIDRAPSSDEIERVTSGEEDRLTESHLIELEAGRLAVAVGLAREDCGNLDSIGPPSGMGSIPSLNTSLSGALDGNGFSGENIQNGTSNESPEDGVDEEKKQFPAPKRFECRHTARRTLTTLVRRALGSNNFDDLSAASSSCNSHLENIKPPSMMDEVDMENSMVSVASITSEVADGGSSGNGGSGNGHSHNGKVGSDGAGSGGSGGSGGGSFFELIRPAAAMAEAYAAHVAAYTMSCSMRTSSGPSLSECLENVNPPSTFDELTDPTDKGESTIEPGTETIGSDTEEIGNEDGGGQNADLLGEGSEGTATPGRSDEGGSAGSTPKKKRDSKKLTPKQRRQLGKDRYRTYTIGGEPTGEEEDPTDINASEIVEEVYCEDEVTATADTKVKTPKQRRQEDRERFLTRTLQPDEQLDNAHVLIGCENSGEHEINECSDVFGNKGMHKPAGPKTLKQKRAEAKERFQTHTISESPSNNNLNSENFNFEGCLELDITAEELEVLERDANLVVSSINATRKTMGSESSASDEPPLIDCETLSLVSDESDTESGERDAKRMNGISNHAVANEVEYNESSSSESDDDDDDDIDEEGNHLPKVKGPRIVKPFGSEDGQRDATENLQDSPKPVRGRRRTLYSSPSKTQRKTSSPSPVSSRKQSPHSQIPVVASVTAPRNSNLPLKVRPTRASALRQTRGGSPHRPARPGKGSSSSSPSPAGSAITSPRVALNSGRGKRVLPKATPVTRSNFSTIGSTPQQAKCNQQELIHSKNLANAEGQAVEDPILTAPPVKQGTFTKEKPSTQEESASNPPKIASPTKTRIPLPASGTEETEQKKKSGIPASKIATPGKLRQPTQLSRLTKTSSQDSATSRASSTSGATPRALHKAATMPVRASNHVKLSQTARKGSISSPPAGIKTSLSNHSLQGNETSSGGTALTRAKGLVGTRRPASVAGNLANGTPKSGSSSSLNSTSSIGGPKEGSNPGTKKKKEVTSKIANLWKKVEESRSRQVDKKDNRVWITNGNVAEGSQEVSQASGSIKKSSDACKSQMVQPRLKPNSSCVPYSNNCGNGEDCEDVEDCGDACQQNPVVLRRKPGRSTNEESSEEKAKRLSRLGSFVRIEAEAGVSSTQPSKPQASAIVPPFNYSPPRRPSSGSQGNVAGARSFIPTSAKNMSSPMSGVKRNPPYSEMGREQVSNGIVRQEEEMTTSSMRVTTV